MLERSVEAGLVEKVKKRGGLCFKFTSPGCSGVPDRIIIYKGRVIFVELKQTNGRLSPIQKVTIEKMRRHGATVYVVYGSRGVDSMLEEVMPNAIQATRIPDVHD